jgi:hypothetical protein
MKIFLTIVTAPVMLLLALTAAVCSFILMMASIVFWILSVVATIGGVILLFTHDIAGGVTLLVIAFLVSPYGLPALMARLVAGIHMLRYSLKEFISGF